MGVEHLRRIYDEYRRAAEQLEALRPQIDAADRLAAAQPRLDAAILHAARINAEHWRFAAEQLEALQPQLDAAILHAARIDDEHRQIAEQLGDFSQRVLVAEQAARAHSQQLEQEKEVSEKLSSLGWYVSRTCPTQRWNRLCTQ